jgi:hypothetical protein
MLRHLLVAALGAAGGVVAFLVGTHVAEEHTGIVVTSHDLPAGHTLADGWPDPGG